MFIGGLERGPGGLVEFFFVGDLYVGGLFLDTEWECMGGSLW